LSCTAISVKFFSFFLKKNIPSVGLGLFQMEGASKHHKSNVQLDSFWSRIIAAPEDEAVTRCIDVFSRLVNSGASLDRNLFLGLVYVAKVRSELFCKQELSLKVLSPTLKPMSMEGKDVLLPLLACNLLVKGYQKLNEWPLDFVQVFLLDSFGARTWVDHDQAASFVAGVLTAFRDKSPNSRYHDVASKEKIRTVALNMVRANIERQENVRGLVRAVTALSSYDECRALAAKRLIAGGWVLDPNLARQTKVFVVFAVVFVVRLLLNGCVKELFESLCARTCLDSSFDVECLRYLLSSALSTLSQSYLTEHRTRLLGNNPSYPVQALAFALLDSNFVAETVRQSLAALPNEQTRARQSGALLYRFCLNKSIVDPVELAVKLLTAYPRLQRLDLCLGLLQEDQQQQLEEDVVSRVENTYRAIVSWQLQGELSEVVRGVVTDIMAAAARWSASRTSVERMQHMLFLSPSDLGGAFSTIGATDAVLDCVSSGTMTPARMALILALVMRSARCGHIKLSPSFAPVLIERVMSNNGNQDVWTASLIVAVLAVLCVIPSAGIAAIQYPTVRKLIMMLVTRRFVANAPTQVLSVLQSVPNLASLASKSRDPDFVVMTLQEDPEAMQSAPLWLPQLLSSGEASFLNGLPVDAALKTLLAATKGVCVFCLFINFFSPHLQTGGVNSPLFAHVAVLASKIDLKQEAVAIPFITTLLDVSAVERSAACAALSQCEGEFSTLTSAQLFEGT
jgi:hypothetical protein